MQPCQRSLQSLRTNRDFLNPTLNLLLVRQLQHSKHLLPAPQMTRSNQAAVTQEILRLDLLPAALGKTNTNEPTMHIQETQMRRKIKVLRRARSIDNKVKRHLVRHIPVLVCRCQEPIRTHLHGICLLRVRARDDPRLSAKSFRKQQPEVSDSAQADDADLLPWPGAVAYERAIGRQASTEHRGCLVG